MTMPEYITKEQAIDAAWDAFTSHDDPDLGRVIEENIECLPTADVAPVVHASWVDDPVYHTHCSRCGCIPVNKDVYLYYPRCGARMDGGDQQ